MVRDPISDVKSRCESLPPFTEDAELDDLLEAMKNKKTHKQIVRAMFAGEDGHKDWAAPSGNRELEAHDIHKDFLIVRGGKGQKDRVIPLVPSIAPISTVHCRNGPAQKVLSDCRFYR